MAKRTRGKAVTDYVVLLRDRHGYPTRSLSKARSFQVKRKGKKLFTKSQRFPTDAKRVKQRDAFLSNTVRQDQSKRAAKSYGRRTATIQEKLKLYTERLERAKTTKTIVKYATLIKELKEKSEKLDKEFKKSRPKPKLQKTKRTLLIEDDEGYYRKLSMRGFDHKHSLIPFTIDTLPFILTEAFKDYEKFYWNVVKALGSKSGQRSWFIRIYYTVKEGNKYVPQTFGLTRRFGITTKRATQSHLSDLYESIIQRFITDSDAYLNLAQDKGQLTGFSVEYAYRRSARLTDQQFKRIQSKRNLTQKQRQAIERFHEETKIRRERATQRRVRARKKKGRRSLER